MADKRVDKSIEVLPGESAGETIKRVNIKFFNVLRYRAIPYYKFVAVNDKKGYAYDIDKGMYPTRSAMLDAWEVDKELQKELAIIEEAHADTSADHNES